MKRLICLILSLCLFCLPSHGRAEGVDPLDEKLKSCLRQSEENPDAARAMAENWLKNGGGDRARLCRAFARFDTGEAIYAAQEFALLAKRKEAGNKTYAARLYAQAALAYRKAGDTKSAETAYTLALDLEQQDPEIWRDRGLARAEAERLWDAIEDFNKALAIMPEMPDVLRARGKVWAQLGLESNARADLIAAHQLDPDDTVKADSKR